MARLPRYTAPGIPQHVIQRGNNRSALFAVESDYLFSRECLRAACEQHGCEVHAYAFMTNHVHMLATPSGDSTIGAMMQSVGRRYVRYFNTVYQRTETLWEGRYRATPIESAQYLFACYRYIELNPVRAGLVAHPSSYPWSSHAANAGGEYDPIVTPRAEYDALGPDAASRHAAYRALFDSALDESTMNAIRGATNGGWALGSRRFRDEVASLAKRRTHPLRAGRPRKHSVTEPGMAPSNGEARRNDALGL